MPDEPKQCEPPCEALAELAHSVAEALERLVWCIVLLVAERGPQVPPPDEEGPEAAS